MKKHINKNKLNIIAETLKGLGHKLRIEILEFVADEERSVSEIVTYLKVEQAVVSQHLKIMKECNILVVEKRGQERIYSIANQKFKNLLSCLQNCSEEN